MLNIFLQRFLFNKIWKFTKEVIGLCYMNMEVNAITQKRAPVAQWLAFRIVTS